MEPAQMIRAASVSKVPVEETLVSWIHLFEDHHRASPGKRILGGRPAGIFLRILQPHMPARGRECLRHLDENLAA
jgi:hypothetical protein